MIDVIFDVDGTLLEWKLTFIRWMLSRGHKLLRECNTMDLTGCFSDVDDIDAIIKEFNNSTQMINLPMISGADIIKDFKNHDNTRLNICTSFSNEPTPIKYRKQNLLKIFGDIFDRYCFCQHVNNYVVDEKIKFIKSLRNQHHTILFDDNYHLINNVMKMNLLQSNNVYIIQHDYNYKQCDILKQNYNVNVLADWRDLNIAHIYRSNN